MRRVLLDEARVVIRHRTQTLLGRERGQRIESRRQLFETLGGQGGEDRLLRLETPVEEDVERLTTDPIEDAIAEIEDVKEIRSTSENGLAVSSTLLARIVTPVM